MDDFKNTNTANSIETKYIASTANRNNTQKLRPEDDFQKSDTLFLYFTVITALLVTFTGNTSLVWASPAVVKLKSVDPNVNPLGRVITTTEISMVMGVPMLVAIFGTSLLTYVANIVGLKKSLLVLGFGQFLSIVSLAFSTRIELIILFLSVSITLYCAGIALVPMYLTEICEDHNRAQFCCLLSLFAPLGNLFTYIVGPAFTYRDFTFITATPIVFFLIFFFYTPETPVFLIKNGKTEECMRSLKKLRSNKTDKQLEIDLGNITKCVLVDKERKGKNVFSLCKQKQVKRGIMLALILFQVRILSGVLVVMSLLAPIFNEAGTKLSGNTIAIIAGVVSVFSAILPYLFIDKFGKKPLLLISTVAVGVFVSLLGVYFFLKQTNSSVIYRIQWLPIVCVACYIIFFSAGLGPIPLAISGELFLPDSRSFGMSVATTSSVITYCVESFSYPLLAEKFGVHWCLWIFGMSCFFGAILLYRVLPETKGKSILEIQIMLK